MASIRSCALARNRATTGDADLPFARTAHSAGLRPGVTVVPVSAGSDLMCVWPEPVDSGKDIIAHRCVLFNTRFMSLPDTQLIRSALAERGY